MNQLLGIGRAVWSIACLLASFARDVVAPPPPPPIDPRVKRRCELMCMPRAELVTLAKMYYPKGRTYGIKRPTLVASVLDYEFGPSPNLYHHCYRPQADKTTERKEEV